MEQHKFVEPIPHIAEPTTATPSADMNTNAADASHSTQDCLTFVLQLTLPRREALGWSSLSQSEKAVFLAFNLEKVIDGAEGYHVVFLREEHIEQQA